MTAKMAPALPTGRTLTVTAQGHVQIVAAVGAPNVDLVGPWVIDVTG